MCAVGKIDPPKVEIDPEIIGRVLHSLASMLECTDGTAASKGFQRAALVRVRLDSISVFLDVRRWLASFVVGEESIQTNAADRMIAVERAIREMTDAGTRPSERQARSSDPMSRYAKALRTVADIILQFARTRRVGP